MSLPPLASGPHDALSPLLATVLDALAEGVRGRGGPLPAGGPGAVAARVRSAVGDLLPEQGDPGALSTIVRTLAEGSADPADPLCAAHLHCPPLALPVAADLAASTLNPSLDSWDQAPAASELEALVVGVLAEEVYGGMRAEGVGASGLGAEAALGAGAEGALAPGAAGTEAGAGAARVFSAVGTEAGPGVSGATLALGAAGAEVLGADAPRAGAPGRETVPGVAGAEAALALGAAGAEALGAGASRAGASGRQAVPGASTPDALVTTGGTESNHLALLLAREAHGASLQLLCGANAHHSLPRAAWLLGLPEPLVVPTPDGILDPAALGEALARLTGPGPVVVAATAGTTDAGLIDPLPEIAAQCAAHGARLHVDAAYGGGLLFSARHRGKLAGIRAAHTVTLDLHKIGWQPVAAGLLAVRDGKDLDVLHHRADYLNADDDTEAGLPDLLGRSLRTTRRPDALKIAVTLKTLGRTGLAELVDQVCDLARQFADRVEAHPRFELHARPVISTVLFRPVGADVAAVRRTLLEQGTAVLGRARTGDGRLWLKATLLNPHTRPADLDRLLDLVEGTTPT
ncbi:pyridoxal phosphate-dependent decarboxylase family protein [Streptomyces acidiscabies]|uniref:pyridoxal phosphate-dependent decarboxylase family protein n=1 Tax=Streptomyces acidiscabies TaxID=42234 RepID=UPI00095B2F7A|nr:aminotransferase class V-fold PLP-dependent enzyme [Streptomyces acidiscabies]GAV42457.1 L-2,4-diaminobutyrate decarboxylase [Streptomyces acidiscabies]